MLTVAELAARRHCDVGYVLVIEGLPHMYTDREELTGTGGFSWLGDSDDREVVLDLTVPEWVTTSTNPETGALESEDECVFTITDFGRRLLSYLKVRDEEAETIVERLSPKDNPAPATLIADTLDSTNIHEMWLNHERIGAFGARRQWQCFPGDPLPGYDHAAVQADSTDLAPSRLYDEATFLSGAKCALYRIFRDVTTGRYDYSAWPSWADQYASGKSLVWFGTITDISQEGLSWRVRCEGPSSWLRKTCAANVPATWQRCTPRWSLSTTPGAREDLFAISFFAFHPSSQTFEQCGASAFDTTNDVLPTSGDVGDIIAAVQARANTLAATLGTDATFTTDHGGAFTISPGLFTIKVQNLAGLFAWSGAILLTLHESVWGVLGVDLKAQRLQLGAQPQDPLQISMMLADENNGQIFHLAQVHQTPAPGYVQCQFSTVPIGAQYHSQYDNDGNPRHYYALNTPGTVGLKPNGGQEVSAGLGIPPYWAGQLARPPAEYTFAEGGGDCDASGFVAFRGSYREEGQEDASTMVQIAKVSWKQNTTLGGAGFSSNDNSELVFHVDEFIDPRLFGVDREPLDRTWVCNDLEYVPVSLIGHNLHKPDYAHLVLLRTLLSTGTASWTGGVRTLGDNAHPDAAHEEGSDVDEADLGLGIYHGLVNWASFVDAANELPEGASGALNGCKHAYIGPFDSQELIQRIIESRGLAIGFADGKFRAFFRPAELAFEDAEVTISPDDYASDDAPYVEPLEFTALAAKDLFRIRYGAPLVDEAGPDAEPVHICRAQDPGARTRQGNAALEFDGQGMITTSLWPAGTGPKNWTPAFSQLMSLMARWYASPHVLVKGVSVLPSKARQIGVGTIVRFTSSPFAATREGTMGFAAKMARVYRKSENLLDGTAKLDLLVQPGDPLSRRRLAPISVVVDDVETVEERFDSSTRTFKCYADAFGHGGTSRDVAYFAEPAWLGIGGDARVYGYQWNGREWGQAFSFSVESVDTAANTITYKAGTFTGTFKEAMYTILVMAPYEDQPASCWVRSLFVVHTGYDLKFDDAGTPTKGFKLQ